MNRVRIGKLMFFLFSFYLHFSHILSFFSLSLFLSFSSFSVFFPLSSRRKKLISFKKYFRRAVIFTAHWRQGGWLAAKESLRYRKKLPLDKKLFCFSFFLSFFSSFFLSSFFFLSSALIPNRS